MDSYLEDILQQRRAAQLYRVRHAHHGAQTPILHLEQGDYLAFCSNDYLGLASHPQLKTTIQQAVEEFAVGSGASHLVTGHSTAHHQLEQALATYTSRERALLFSTGYMANIGVISALMGRNDEVFLDKLDHASLIDAAILSRAKLSRYPHNDVSALENLLAKSTAAHKLIVVDGVFSMDGDLADLPAIVALAKRYDAWVMVDDAHGLGVLGETGRGTLQYFGLTAQDVPILMGTLGKAFGVFGAFVAGSELLIEVLIQNARSYIYTTALPPALAAATEISLQLADSETWRREQLKTLIAHLQMGAARRNIPLQPSITPIQVLMLGSAERALAVSAALLAKGILVTAIRPPTVPANTARLRITLSALHQVADVERLLNALAEVLAA